IGLGEIDLDRLLGGGSARAFLFNACNREAHLFGTLAPEHFAGNDRSAERDNACEQHPAGNGIEAVVHGVPWFPRGSETDAFWAPLTGDFAQLQELSQSSR